MSDSIEYFRSHAFEAARKARQMAHGRMRNKQLIVARMYHLLATHLLIKTAGENPQRDFKVSKSAPPDGASEQV